MRFAKAFAWVGLGVLSVAAGSAKADTISIPRVDNTLLIEVTRLTLSYDGTTHALSVTGNVFGARIANAASSPGGLVATGSGGDTGTFSLVGVVDPTHNFLTSGTVKVVDTQAGSPLNGTLFDATIAARPNFQLSANELDFLLTETGASALSAKVPLGAPVGLQLIKADGPAFDFSNTFNYTTAPGTLKADIFVTVPTPSAAWGGSALLVLLGASSLRRRLARAGR